MTGAWAGDIRKFTFDPDRPEFTLEQPARLARQP
jgi:hypothetical protein